ncbi:hypothetical protein FHW16_005192 [Phyllobacterium myrsinacearum]|uniref:Uncharacterized protein n=1 Tax=Phyllobacterium myrsinacearum TaxID=28101 RepID=A0A839EMZ3_9HYPH|nr:hypothetical protein [Phyllobacterium myrsinacearum]
MSYAHGMVGMTIKLRELQERFDMIRQQSNRAWLLLLHMMNGAAIAVRSTIQPID